MDEAEIKKKISQSIELSSQGLSQEHPKFDFKHQWYNLKDNKEINEFLKDACAIANTPGGDGFIVIGFDEKTKEFYPARFSDSGLRDTSDINGIVRSKVDPEIEINILDVLYDEHPISVLHIPESINKPYVIKQFMRFSKPNQEVGQKTTVFSSERTPQ
jgi:predicted HTH transcriptional regulator